MVVVFVVLLVSLLFLYYSFCGCDGGGVVFVRWVGFGGWVRCVVLVVVVVVVRETQLSLNR